MNPEPPFFAEDEAAMRQALALAENSIGLSEPNPRVGCVIVGKDKRVLGQGFTQQAGGPHAEVMALRDAAQQGNDVTGATAYVTLEPCSHHGRTPPCCDALIAAKLSRVVTAIEDPNPLVAGAGIERLRNAGISVDVGLLANVAREINIGFFSRMQRKRPWVRLKTAISLDGRTALENGISQWITGSQARADGHAWRKRAGAVLTGVGTVKQDDPRLDVRLVETAMQPLRVIVDSKLQTPATAKILHAPGRVLIYTADAAAANHQPLIDRGAEIAVLPNADQKVDIGALLSDLAVRGINELHVEAGQKLSGSFIREGWVDELLIYQAPRLLGPGHALAVLPPLDKLANEPDWQFISVERIDDDLRLIARRRSS